MIRPTTAIGIATLICLASGRLATDCKATSDDLLSQPGVLEVSAAEQATWLDKSVPTLVAAMRESKDVREKIAGPLTMTSVSSPPLKTDSAGLGPGELERWSALVDKAIASNLRYSKCAQAKPQPAATTLPHAHIVRVETRYPAPAATKELEPGPLTIDAWICPDRQTALALFWLRKGGFRHVNTTSSETLKRSVLDIREDAMGRKVKDARFTQMAIWDHPRNMISVVLAKGDEPMPPDRLLFIRDNVVVETATVEYVLRKSDGKWYAGNVRDIAPDIVEIMQMIDNGLGRK